MYACMCVSIFMYLCKNNKEKVAINLRVRRGMENLMVGEMGGAGWRKGQK